MFLIKLRCTDCGRRFQRTVAEPDAPDPPCPHCAKQGANIGLDVAAGKAPAVGGNPANRAMDFTMETVAEEYGFTDLRTDAREGETMTPKLPPQQQQMADGMFDPSKRKGATGRKMNQIAATALAGGYKTNDAPDPIGALHATRQPGAKIKANYVAGDGIP